VVHDNVSDPVYVPGWQPVPATVHVRSAGGVNVTFTVPTPPCVIVTVWPATETVPVRPFTSVFAAMDNWALVAVELTAIQEAFEVADQEQVAPVVTGMFTTVAPEATLAADVPRLKEHANEAVTFKGAFTVNTAGFPLIPPLQPANV
jgi:hypothetical protein